MKPLSTDETDIASRDSGRERYTIGALSNGLDVLECFGEREAWSLGEIADHLNLNKATAFRVLSTLESKSFVEKRYTDGRFVLGTRLLALGTGALRFEQLRWQALPPLKSLAERTGESVHVGVMYEGDVVTVQLVDGLHDVRMHSSLGKRSPAHASSMGKVILAHYSPAELEDYAREPGLRAFTPHSITEVNAFLDEMRAVRTQGYAIDNEEVQLDVRCVGAAISDHTGRVVAGVSLSGPSSRMTDERIEEVIPLVKLTARTISRMLGSPSLFRSEAQ